MPPWILINAYVFLKKIQIFDNLARLAGTFLGSQTAHKKKEASSRAAVEIEIIHLLGQLSDYHDMSSSSSKFSRGNGESPTGIQREDSGCTVSRFYDARQTMVGS